jgi:hypothetical protein
VLGKVGVYREFGEGEGVWVACWELLAVIVSLKGRGAGMDLFGNREL